LIWTPVDKPTAMGKEVLAERDRKLEEARDRRATARSGSQEIALQAWK
jgi:hypothetical protein